MKEEENVFELINNNINSSSNKLSKGQIKRIKSSIEYHEDDINRRALIDQEDLTNSVVKL